MSDKKENQEVVTEPKKRLTLTLTKKPADSTVLKSTVANNAASNSANSSSSVVNTAMSNNAMQNITTSNNIIQNNDANKNSVPTKPIRRADLSERKIDLAKSLVTSGMNSNNNANDSQKSGTLSIGARKTDASSGEKTGEKILTRSTVFTVPVQQRSFGGGGYARENRIFSPEDREKRMNFLKTAERARSNVQFGGPKSPVFTPTKTYNKKPERRNKAEYGEGGAVSKTHKQGWNDDKRLNIGMGVVQTFSEDLNIEADRGWRKVRTKRESAFNYKPSVVKTIDVYEGMEVQTLATEMSISMKDLSKKLKSMGLPTNVTAVLDADSAELLVIECGHKVKRVNIVNVDDDPVEDYVGNAKPRAPIVTIVGHVDHGKTSLLDAIRNANVASGEAGGITQHIGAYQVKSSKDSMITFLDTPGHETFTAMRARGVQLTDIAVLVVAADDGIQEQTVEAIKHIKNAGVQFIVAITKVDKPDANPDKVLDMLLAYDIVTDKHGGDVLAVKIAAIKGIGIKELLDAIALQADMMELKVRDEGFAIGVVIEAKVQKGFGNVANIIVQKGCLKIGDHFVVGKTFGKVRCLIDTTNEHVKVVGPSMPVSVICLDAACLPGDRLVVVPSEIIARDTAKARIEKIQQASYSNKSLEDLYSHMQQNKTLNVLLKGDTVGSVEALQQGIGKVKNDEVTIKVVDASVGPVNESDVLLAEVSKAIIISFHNKVGGAIMKFATEKFVHVIAEDVIYKILEDLQKLIDGMIEPVYDEVKHGKAKIIKVFEFSKGVVAGCQVVEGKIIRGFKLRVIRNGVVIGEGDIRSLQRETQDVKEAIHGHECGLMINDFKDYKIGDEVVCFELVQKK